MGAYLPFVVLGLVTGSVYALAAMGLVVTYTTSGVFNFAHGAIGMIVAYVFVTLREDAGVPTAVALAACVLVMAPLIGVALDRVLFRRLTGGTAATYLVASIGLLVALQGTAVVVLGPEHQRTRPLFPRRTVLHAGELRVGFDQAAVVVVVAVLGAALVAFFRRTHLGRQTRAVVDNRDLTGLVGTDAARVTMVSWAVGCAFAGLSGILIAPFIGLDAVLLTLLVLQAVAAAVVGGCATCR